MTQLQTRDDFSKFVFEYIKGFDHHIVIKLGPSWSPECKEVYKFCVDHLGVQYKDWFIVSGGGKGQTGVLHVKDTKWLTLMHLQFPNLVDHSFDF